MKRQALQFSEPLKQAILDGAKVQTRRIVKPQPSKPTTAWYADAADSGKWVAMGPGRIERNAQDLSLGQLPLW